MKTNNKVTSSSSPYIEAGALFKRSINTVDDIKRLYVGVNHLALEISKDKTLVDIISSGKYNEDEEFLKGIVHILSYGQAVKKKSPIFSPSEVKIVSLNTLFKKNPDLRYGIQQEQEKAFTLFDFLKIKSELDEKEKLELKKQLVEARKTIKIMRGALAIFVKEKELREALEKKKSISYNKNLGRITINGKKLSEISGKQKGLIDCLMEAGKDKRVSWEKIYEDTEGMANKIYGKLEQRAIKKSVLGIVYEINKKTQAPLEAGEKSLLIGMKKNEYWLQYEINKEE